MNPRLRRWFAAVVGKGGGAATFQELILAFGDNLLSYLPLDETSGSVAADASGNNRTGAYGDVTLNNGAFPAKVGGAAPLWDGTGNDYVNWYTASFAAAFSGVAGTVGGLGKVSAAGVWADGTERELVHLRADASNRSFIAKTTNSNEIIVNFTAGGTAKNITSTALAGSTAWFLWSFTWDKNAGASGEMKAYLNGVQVGTTQTALGTWAGAPSSTLSNIGAINQTGAAEWDGWIGHCFLLNRASTGAEIAALWAAANP